MIIIDPSAPLAPTIQSVTPQGNQVLITWSIATPHVAITNIRITVGLVEFYSESHLNSILSQSLLYASYQIVIEALNEFGVSEPDYASGDIGGIFMLFAFGIIVFS